MHPRLHTLIAACGLAAATPAIAQTLPASYPSTAPAQQLPPAQDPILLQKLDLLRQRIAQRDQIQREIDQLIVETGTPQVITVHLELLEINVSAAEKLGEDFRRQSPQTEAAGAITWTAAEIELLREKGIALSLAKPQLMTASGQQATSRVANGESSPATEVQLRPDSLGNNQVHLDLFVERTAPSTEKKSEQLPGSAPQKFSMTTGLDLQFGETRVLSGLLMKRTQTRRGALGRVTESVTIEHVLLVRAEGVMPRAAGVVPASAIAPR